MENYLTDAERADLRAKYKEDNLRDAPANIKDKTLITNYGNDEQRKRLETSAAGDGAEQKGKEDESGADPGTGTDPVAEIEKVIKEDAPSGEMEPSDDKEAQDFKTQFNEYVRLHGQAPEEGKTAAELRELNSQKAADVEMDEALIENSGAGATKGVETISLIHKETGERINPTVFTYENFIRKTQPEFVPVASVKPKEIRKK